MEALAWVAIGVGIWLVHSAVKGDVNPLTDLKGMLTGNG